ncbi:MAG: squalene/phytoene synthase family protein [Erythrobacter sp.]
MAEPASLDLAEEQRLALAYSPGATRPALASLFALDRRLSQLVARTSEPMLGQMRLAWWRDMLGKASADRPAGDVVLDALGQHWGGHERELIAMVDAWEVLLAGETLTPGQLHEFGEGRAAPFGALQRVRDRAAKDRVAAAAFHWAMADAAAHCADPQDRAALVEAGLARTRGGGRIEPGLRGLAVLQALALRALRRGGRPLLEGRGAALVALRAGLLGR